MGVGNSIPIARHQIKCSAPYSELELPIRTIAEEQEELQKLHFRIIYKNRREWTR